MLRQCGARWPLQIDAIVILPDHLHTIWTLPPTDSSYSVRWGWLKKEFTKAWLRAGKRELPQSGGRERDGRRGIWQSKFWEHAVRDQHDYGRHMDLRSLQPGETWVHGLPAPLAVVELLALRSARLVSCRLGMWMRYVEGTGA